MSKDKDLESGSKDKDLESGARSVRERLETFAQEQARLLAEWEMPEVFPGMPILFNRDPNTNEWLSAFVTKADARQVTVGVLQDMVPFLQPFSNVRHADDPEIQVRPSCISESGVWRHTDFSNDVRLAATLGQRMSAIEDRFAKIEKFVGGKG